MHREGIFDPCQIDTLRKLTQTTFARDYVASLRNGNNKVRLGFGKNKELTSSDILQPCADPRGNVHNR